MDSGQDVGEVEVALAERPERERFADQILEMDVCDAIGKRRINAAGSPPPAARWAVSGQKAMRLLVNTRSISSGLSAIVLRCG